MAKYTYAVGQTPLDEDEKSSLIPNVISRKDLDYFERENILEARRWVMSSSVLSRQNIFTEKFILNLHKRMYCHVWKWAGTYRKTGKNIGVEAYKISIEFHRLLSDALYWLDHETYSVTDLAIIFHHCLVKIHLFPNGNGRHARLCADVIVAKHGGKKLSWGASLEQNQLDVVRKKYISALRDADYGDYKALFEFAKS